MRYFLISCALLGVSCNTAQPPGIPSSTIWEFKSSIRALSLASDGGIWWAGSKGLIGHSNDAGATWSVDTLRLSDGSLPAFRSIAVTDEAAFALTIASPAVLFRQEIGSDHWKPVYINEDTLAFFDSMHFWDAREGLAMGDPMGGCLSILITRDSGGKHGRWFRAKIYRLWYPILREPVKRPLPRQMETSQWKATRHGLHQVGWHLGCSTQRTVVKHGK